MKSQIKAVGEGRMAPHILLFHYEVDVMIQGLPTLRFVDSQLLAGEFWQLKSARLKVAKFADTAAIMLPYEIAIREKNSGTFKKQNKKQSQHFRLKEVFALLTLFLVSAAGKRERKKEWGERKYEIIM